MSITILDCYTDEPSGLGVPPYLGTYPRYIAGYLKQKAEEKDINYITIDDLRSYHKEKKKPRDKEIKKSELKFRTLDFKKLRLFEVKTNIKTYNLTRTLDKIKQILENTSELIVISGIHVPGKYLSALPGTLAEVTTLIKVLNCRKILSGPAIFGTQLYGGKMSEKINTNIYNKIEPFNFSYEKIKQYAIDGAFIIKQIPDLRIIELETGKGCNVGRCSFCTEPIKSKVFYRPEEDILEEVKTFYNLGQRYFRYGKQTCFYSYSDPINLLKQTRKLCPDIEVLHIDNVNPIFVPTKKGEEITKAIVKYCTPGNIAAFGVESFDPEVTKQNTLNCSGEMALKAIRSINKYGAEKGPNGMPKFLPGINIIFGLKGETKQTHEHNMKYLNQILKENLLIRRINIRQVAIFEGTALYETVKTKFIKKNKKFYWKWRNEIRQKIDYEMLKRLLPKGSILKNIWAETYDGKTTFCRQIGTYPLIVGVKQRLPLFKFYNIKVKDHMLRSIVGELA